MSEIVRVLWSVNMLFVVLVAILCCLHSTQAQTDDDFTDDSVKFIRVSAKGVEKSLAAPALAQVVWGQCGHSKYADAGGDQARSSRPNEFPYMVSMQYNGFHWCSGAILNSQWIVTSAICFYDSHNRVIDINNVTVVVGEHQLSVHSSTRQTFPAYEAAWYPLFEITDNIKHNIGLIQIEGSITFSENVSAVCLPFNATDTFADRGAYMTGWKYLNYPSNSQTDLQQSTPLTVVNDTYCRNTYLPAGIVTYSTMLCAVNRTNSGTRNLCEADDASIVAVKDPVNGTFTLVGILSAGYSSDDCTKMHLSISTRVARYLTFIYSTIGYPPGYSTITEPPPGQPPTVPAGTAWHCGRSVYTDAGQMPVIAPRIVGGIYARPNEFPWQVSLLSSKTDLDSHFCGGSIINSRWILTAGHCVKADGVIEKPWNIFVAVGEHVRNSSSAIRQIIPVLSVHPHDYYTRASAGYDIALLYLSSNITFTDYVSAVCLPDPTDLYVNRKCVVSGWGQTSPADYNSAPKTLMYTTLNITSTEYCQSEMNKNPSGYRPTIYTSQVCAVDNAYGYDRDTCQGDSGGPLVVQESDGFFHIAGLTSWGFGCADGIGPGIYTRVSSYLTWMQELISRVDPSAPPLQYSTKYPMTTTATTTTTAAYKKNTAAALTITLPLLLLSALATMTGSRIPFICG